MRCAEFYEKWKKHPQFCELSKDSVKLIDAYIDTVDQIVSRGIEEKSVYINFPEGAARPVLNMKSGDAKNQALDFVMVHLKKGEKVPAKDLKNLVSGLTRKDTVVKNNADARGEEKTIVGNRSPDTEVKKQDPAKTFSPQPGSIPVTDAPVQPSLKEQIGKGLNEQEKAAVAESIDRHHDTLVKLSGEQQPRKAPCLNGDPCPDGKRHMFWPDEKNHTIKGTKCDVWNQFVLQMIRDECPLDAKARKEAERAAGGDTGFIRASGIVTPPKSTQPLPTISKHPLLKTRKEQDAATETFIDNCLSDRYHRVIRDAMTDHQLNAPLDAVCKALDLLSEWEGEPE